MKRRNALARKNPSALATARSDPFGRVAVPMFAAALGATAGLLIARPLQRSPMAGGIVGALSGLAAYMVVDTIDQRR